jgi:hypothetical protein
MGDASNPTLCAIREDPALLRQACARLAREAVLASPVHCVGVPVAVLRYLSCAPDASLTAARAVVGVDGLAGIKFARPGLTAAIVAALADPPDWKACFDGAVDVLGEDDQGATRGHLFGVLEDLVRGHKVRELLAELKKAVEVAAGVNAGCLDLDEDAASFVAQLVCAFRPDAVEWVSWEVLSTCLQAKTPEVVES